MRPILISAPIILLTLFLGGCWHVPSQPPAAPPTSGGSDTATSTTEIDTADWLTYTNEEYGFGFRYPREWVHKTDSVAVDPSAPNGDPITHIINIDNTKTPAYLMIIIHDLDNSPSEIKYPEDWYYGEGDVFIWSKDNIKSNTERVKKHRASQHSDGLTLLDEGREGILYNFFDGGFVRKFDIVSGNDYIRLEYNFAVPFDLPDNNTGYRDPVNLATIKKELERLRFGTLSTKEQEELFLFQTITKLITSL